MRGKARRGEHAHDPAHTEEIAGTAFHRPDEGRRRRARTQGGNETNARRQDQGDEQPVAVPSSRY
jgi:hypothetical protein